MTLKTDEAPPKRPAYFWWLLANALALCFAVVSWAVCLDVFGNPEVPRNYEILRKLGRLPVLKHYTITDVPNGNAFAPKELYQRYFGHSPEEMKRVNALLMRNYIMNFDQPLLLTYVEGDYQVEQSRKLTPKDFISPGVAIRAQALVKPDDFTKPLPYPVFIEYLIPTDQMEGLAELKTGESLTIKKSPHCAAVVHISKMVHEGDQALLLTAVPIAYGNQQLLGKANFSVEVPNRIRPAASFPAF